MYLAIAALALVLSAQGAAGFLLQASALGPAYAPRHALSTRAWALAAGRSHVCAPRPLLRGPPPLAQVSREQRVAHDAFMEALSVISGSVARSLTP